MEIKEFEKMVNACDVCEISEQCAEICNNNGTYLPEELVKLAACEYDSHTEYAEAIGVQAFVKVNDGKIVSEI
jgi:hypothetical protein